jgi:hypothetical protein
MKNKAPSQTYTILRRMIDEAMDMVKIDGLPKPTGRDMPDPPQVYIDSRERRALIMKYKAMLRRVEEAPNRITRRGNRVTAPTSWGYVSWDIGKKKKKKKACWVMK